MTKNCKLLQLKKFYFFKSKIAVQVTGEASRVEKITPSTSKHGIFFLFYFWESFLPFWNRPWIQHTKTNADSCRFWSGSRFTILLTSLYKILAFYICVYSLIYTELQMVWLRPRPSSEPSLFWPQACPGKHQLFYIYNSNNNQHDQV